MESYSPEDILGRSYPKVLEDPGSYDFGYSGLGNISPDVESIKESEDFEIVDSDGFFEFIALDKSNQNIVFSLENYGGAKFYRAVDFGEDYTLIQSVSKNSSPKPINIDSDFSQEKEFTVLHYLTTGDENYIFTEEEYEKFTNDRIQRAHRTFQEILNERPFSKEILEPADD
ncbi:MAG: hypothetical protein R6V35_05120 [Candidatus Nanohaloarchaea archaeon]